ncbi:heterokaryon incompatibility protein-domain-containing protein [Xylaria longipes]|nr:heterokaryon incompatibility protein-domain-containing protein [Xylaria longipes]
MSSHVSYVALSYTWGTCRLPGDEALPNEDMPPRLPLTIEDAIEVTLRLNYRYLWIDRYCIIQNGPQKAAEIERMDEVYNGAEVVIIDAVGEDPSQGLAGVSYPRTQQPVFSNATQTLVGLFKHLINHVRASKWSSRGWTYQEALMARRRLFFTCDQVYFECHVGAHMETLCKSITGDSYIPSIVDDTSRKHYRRENASRPPLYQYLEEYTRRELTYPSDALIAFLGVFRSFERQSEPVRHYWGVPILRLTHEEYEIPVSPLQAFVGGLCWTSIGAQASRRAGFPSWSWVGWDFERRGITYEESTVRLQPSLMRFRISLKDEMLDWNEFWQHWRKHDSTVDFYSQFQPSCLLLKGRVVDIYASGKTDRCHCGACDELRLGGPVIGNSGKSSKDPLIRAALQRVSGTLQPLTAIVIGESAVNLDFISSILLGDGEKLDDRYTPWMTVLLLLDKQRTESPQSLSQEVLFERIGWVRLGWRSFQDYENSQWFLQAKEREVLIV